MKKVYQTIFESEKGNCYQAVIASLLDLELGDVPHFMLSETWFGDVTSFMMNHGYERGNYLVNSKRLGATEFPNYHLPEVLPREASINGYFDAIVFSPKYFDLEAYKETKEGPYHAVVCDENYNIIHDPTPEYDGVTYPLADELGKNGIVGIEYWKKL